MQCNLSRTEAFKFIEGEELGTEVQPRCGGCKCSKCPILGHTYSFSEEQELNMIRNNLQYDEKGQCWITKYPWLIDPNCLPNNYSSAYATLCSTERTLSKDETKVYNEQIQDMVQRGVARQLSHQELKDWTRPKFYLSHLAVSNPKSTSTQVRIVFNSSQVHQGFSLNTSLATGPYSYLNNWLGIILRWRENYTAIQADIPKMYNLVFIEEVKQHCHRLLWRDLETDRQPDKYIITRVNMGDRPAAAISTEAIYMTAKLFEGMYPRVAELLRSSTYVDDIVDSVSDLKAAEDLAKDKAAVLARAGFKVSSWLFNSESIPRVDPSQPASEKKENSVSKVLGISWKPQSDKIFFKPSLNFSKKRQGVYAEERLTQESIPAPIPEKLTRRKVLEQTMKIYDPMGIMSSFTQQAKCLLRETRTLKLGWDEELPNDLRSKWISFFS